MDVKTRVFVKELLNGLISSKTQGDIEKWLRISKVILTAEKTWSGECEGSKKTKCERSESKDNDPILISLGWESDQIFSLKKEVIKCHARRILECIISLFTLEWVTELSPQKYNVLVKSIFLQCESQDAIICLLETVCFCERKDYSFQKCVSLLEGLMTRQQLSHLLEQHIYCAADSPSKAVLTVDAQNLIASLAGLPEKLANRLQHENSDAFLPQNYIPKLALSIYDCLRTSHTILSKSQDVSLLMVSSLVGKLCLVGYADLLLDTLLPYLCIKVRSDYLWCRICERVFSCMPARNLESVVSAVLRKIPWYGLVEKFLGDCVVHNSSIKNLICVKLLLHKYYSKPRLFLHNVIGYLSSSHARRPLFIEVFVELLRVWGDGSSMKHISNEQHLYISKSLMLCISLLNKEEKAAYKSDLLRILMPGVQAHLESNNHDIRMVGMAVAKSLIGTVDPEGPQLEFEVDGENSKIKDLLSYQGLPEDPGLSEAEIAIQSGVEGGDLNNCDETNDTLLEDRLHSLKFLETKESDHEELDSDDDFVAYDMSNDKKVTEAKIPKYVRDCMEGLICGTDNPARMEVCLEHAENLIRKNTDGLEEISAEFAKILLHLNDTHSFDNFILHRFSSMVALTVMCPSTVSDYLTSQFYERNYNTRQRLDILEVLANAAQELSQPKTVKKPKEPQPKTASGISPSSWRETVQKRIESNTRRFAKGRTQPLPTPTENRLSKVAGQFFYPLMAKVDQSDPCMDLIGKDTLLLYRLLYTLAIVLHSATNLPNATQMGGSLLEFTWPLRLHPDSCVRQAVLICTTTVFLAVPTFQLVSQLHSDVTEVKSWLEDVFEKDADSECQKMSAQALLLLDEQIKKEVNKDNTS